MATKPPLAELICVGAVTGARGIKGDIRIKSFTDDPEAIASYGPLYDKTGTKTFDLQITGQAKGQLVGRIKGTPDRNAAEKLKGLQFFVPRDVLPAPDDDEFYFSDLIGLRVEDREGKSLGTIQSVDDYGAGNVLEIVGVVAGGLLVPFTKQTVPRVDIGKGLVVVDPPDGLFDPPEAQA
ncbi:MAG: ribosome maturation factor RimM [Rhodospirillales bacterium]|nr:ribosome maturation factor RimM [Rhodospirillales bacterium]